MSNQDPNNNRPASPQHTAAADAPSTAAHPHDAMIQASMADSAALNAQVQADLAQQHTQRAQASTQAFGTTQDLPPSAPQGQQMTRPASHSMVNDAHMPAQTPTPLQATGTGIKTGYYDRSAIQNPHTQATDGDEVTHFGYQSVRKSEKQDRVAEVFTSVAKKYDIMNDLMSFGIHRLWKRYAISLTGVRAGQHVLDIAGGTGDLAKVFSREVGRSGRVVLSDINEAMLEVGRERLLNAGCNNVDFVLANAETLAPFADESFDLVTISFGLRNVTDKDAALRSMYRVLKKGGRLLVLEFSKPVFEPLSKAYDVYSFTALPLMGKLVANDSASYQYLAESIRMHPDQQTLKTMMQDAGFVNCDYHNLTGGIVAVHRGFKK